MTLKELKEQQERNTHENRLKELKQEKERLAYANRKEYYTRGNTARCQELFARLMEVEEKIRLEERRSLCQDR